MATDFSRTLSLLRQEMGISQRKAAAALGISQALLSHYENGIREPGLAFVARACDFYHVSADFLLGRTNSRDGSIIEAGELYDASDEKGTLKGSILATLQKKLVVNTTNLLFDLLGRIVGRLGASRPAGEHRRAGKRAHHQRGRQSQQQELLPTPALTRGFGGHEKRHHALFIVSGKVNGVHGTPQFRFYIMGHTTWLLSSVSSARSFRRPRDRYWVMLASDLPITWAISLAEYSS